MAVASAIALPAAAASAQIPQVPEIDPCLTNPSSCLPDAPETPQIDRCLQDPASCLPDTSDPPSTDRCLEDPASCLPADPEEELDDCLGDAASCVPSDGCDPSRDGCLPLERELDGCVERTTRCLEDDDTSEEDDEGAVVPGGAGGSRGGAERSGPGGVSPPRARLDARGLEVPTRPAASGTTPAEPESASEASLLDRIGSGLLDAAERFTFPIAVGIVVLTFLLVQGRIDRRDPKLVTAPIDSRHDLVAFR